MTGTRQPAAKPPIFIVEDDHAVRHSLRMVLELYGHPVEEFDAGEDLLARGVPAGCCVILDVKLPGAGGLQILDRLRAASNEAPVILVTGSVTPRILERAQRLAHQGILEKPIDVDDLLSRIGP